MDCVSAPEPSEPQPGEDSWDEPREVGHLEINTHDEKLQLTREGKWTCIAREVVAVPKKGGVGGEGTTQ